MRFLITASFIFTVSQSFSQFTAKIWDNTIGGANNDYLRDAIPTADGGYLLAGESASAIGYDKTQPCKGSYDYWIIKLNESGSVIWDRTIGSAEYDHVSATAQGSDGNYLIVGNTTAGISGDKSEASMGLSDYWLLCLDPLGNIIWQNAIGGSGDDVPTDVISVPGGYIVGGYSTSGISGDKTIASYGGQDFWLMKINLSGNIVWQFAYGGSVNDRLWKIKKLLDGSYVLAGDSESGISGVKTVPNYGLRDLWFIKIGGGGSVLWQQDFGSASYDYLGDILEMEDGGFMVASYSSGNITGIKTELSANIWSSCCDYGIGEGSWSDVNDTWLLRLNELGELIWDNTYQDVYSNKNKVIFSSAPDRYCIAGDEWMDESPEPLTLETFNEDGYRIYATTLNGGLYYEDDEYGSINYTNGNCTMGTAFPMPDGSYIVAGSSDALADDFKSEGVMGVSDLHDFWIIKMGPDTCTLKPLYTDYDQDGAAGDWVSNVCANNLGYTMSTIMDCDDNRSAVNPLAIEICDGLDNNCNGVIDDGLLGCIVAPEVFWDASYGGDSLDEAHQIAELADGFVIGSTITYASHLDAGYFDAVHYSVRKIDFSGNEIWYRTIGGNYFDWLTNCIATPDGGVLIAGSSSSGIYDDKTEASIGTDCWLVKLNVDGIIEWQNTISGFSTDQVVDLKSTSDGGFILLASSTSGIGADKTEGTHGSDDAWIVKLTSTGIIEWQNDIGGLSSDSPQIIVQTSDGGYIVGMSSLSGLTGDKTVVNYGGRDYWIIKLNADGTIQWQKDFGGAMDELLVGVVETTDGGYIIAGTSSSDISALKSEESLISDIWLIKINALGSMIWENTIQGSGYEQMADFITDPSGGYIALATTASAQSNDKSEPNVVKGFVPIPYETSYYQYDYWLLHIDELGGIDWQNTIGGNQMDQAMDLLMTSGNDIITLGWSESARSSDKSDDNIGKMRELFYEDEYYETPLRLDRQAWLVYFDYTCMPVDEICNAYDDDCNGLVDDGVVELASITAAGPTAFCPGGAVTLFCTYTGDEVQWKRNGIAIPGATFDSLITTMKGSYTCVTTSDCGIGESTPLIVNVYKNPAAIITADGATTFCLGESVGLSANTGVGLNYQWYADGIAIPGAIGSNYTANHANTYTCRVTKAATGCNKLSNAIIVTIPCRVGEQETISELEVFPVPAINNVTIHGCEVNMPILVFDALGQVVISQIAHSAAMELNITELAAGPYLIRSGELSVRFMKQ